MDKAPESAAAFIAARLPSFLDRTFGSVDAVSDEKGIYSMSCWRILGMEPVSSDFCFSRAMVLV
jgi:hypothetical protein